MTDKDLISKLRSNAKVIPRGARDKAADTIESLTAERDAALNKAESLGWAVDALKQSVETMERRAGEFKAERDKLLAENANLQGVAEDAIRILKGIRAVLGETEK